MSTVRGLYLFCYDISCPRRWRAVHRLLLGYRVAGQLSVFECLMTEAERDRALADIGRIIDATQDRVHVLRLDPRQRHEGWGRARFHDGGPLLVT